MIYNSFNFIILYPLLFLLYYAIPARWQQGRNGYLLLVSYLLYASWKPVYALILLGVTAVTYGCALFLERQEKKRRGLLVGGGNYLASAIAVLQIFQFYQ